MLSTASCSSASHAAKASQAPSPTPSRPSASADPAPKASSNQLFFDTGTGNATTDTFTVPSSWEIETHYNCPSGVETFSAQIVDSSGVPVLDTDLTSVNDFGAANDLQTTESKAGTFALQIMTDCEWTVVVRRTP